MHQRTKMPLLPHPQVPSISFDTVLGAYVTTPVSPRSVVVTWERMDEKKQLSR